PHCSFLQRCAHSRHIHSFPTRRSSDLSKKPSMPLKPQYTTQNTAIWAAMAPMTMLKFRPMPASTGISRESTIKPLRPIRVNSSRSEEHTSELQSRFDLVCRLLLETKKT